VALAAVFLFSGVASATTFDLSGDWSNSSNPNVPWTYEQGSTALPAVSDWTAAGTGLSGCDQPAWAPSNIAGSFLPAMMQIESSCSENFFGTDPNDSLANVMSGDIVVHTVDNSNGNLSNGVANFVLTLPSGDAGQYAITGSVWDAKLDQPTRTQAWEILVNGVEEASGSLDGSVSRSDAETFDVLTNLNPGDTVELELYETNGSGYYVGTHLNVNQVGPLVASEPRSLLLLAGGLLGLAGLRRRSAQISI
jgi:hypothetical protein